MALHSYKTILMLEELKTFENKYTAQILHNSNIDELETTFKNLLECKNITNKELAIVFDTIMYYYKHSDITTEISIYFVEYTFPQETKDLDIALLSYFRFLHYIYETAQDNTMFTQHYFNRCYDAITNKIIKSAILKEIYCYLKKIMKTNKYLFDIFVQNRYYKRFLFFNAFLNDFYSYLDDQQSVEVFVACKYEYQRKLMIVGRNFNYYLVMLFPSLTKMISFELQFYQFGYSILNNEILYNSAADNQNLLIDVLHININNKKLDVINCVFLELHDKHIYLENCLNKINEALELFNTKKDIKLLLDEIFDNPMYYLRANRKTDLRSLGEFLGKEKNQKYLEMFCSTFSLEGSSLLCSLRVFLSSFILPGESQAITRILEQFSLTFYNGINNLETKTADGRNNDVLNNKNIIDIKKLEHEEQNTTDDPFELKQEDIYIIVFSLIMLNTSLHNINMKLKTSKRMFIENIRKCKISEKFDNNYLGNLYDDVKKNKFKFVDQNTCNPLNYKMYKMAVHSIKDKTIRNMMHLIYPDDNLYNIEKNICCNCKYFAYESIFRKNIDMFITHAFGLKSCAAAVNKFIEICKHYGTIEINYRVMLYIYNNYSEDMLGHFFGLYMFSIENDQNCDDLKNLKCQDISFYHLPIYIIQKHFISTKLDMNIIFKKDNHVTEKNKKTIARFIRNSASMNDAVFTNIVGYNLYIDCNDTLEIIFDIVLKNVFRSQKIISPEFIRVLSNHKNFLNLFTDKIIEMRLSKEILEVLKCLQTIKYNIESIIFDIVKNHAEIVDIDLGTFIQSFILPETRVHFNILLHLQKSHSSFEFISGTMMDLIYDEIAKNEEKIDLNKFKTAEKFSNYLSDPSKFISYCLSSNEYINLKVIHKFEAFNNGKCVFDDLNTLQIINRQITYVLVKCSIINNREMIQYCNAYTKALSNFVYLLCFYLASHQRIFSSLHVTYQKILIKNVISSINQYLTTPSVCKCNKDHNLKHTIANINDSLIENKIIQKGLIPIDKYTKPDKNDIEFKDVNIETGEDEAEDQVYEL